MSKVVIVEFGTLTRTISGGNNPFGLWDSSLNLDAIDLIASLRPQYVCIVSNQEGIEKGTVNKRDLEFQMEYFLRSTREILHKEHNINPIIEYSYCPFVNSYFKLPGTGMIERFLRRYTTNITPSMITYIGKIKETATALNCEYIKA